MPFVAIPLLLALAIPPPDPGQHARTSQAPDARGLLRVDPAFFELSAATGGDFYFWAPGEFAASGVQLPIHDDPVVLAYGVLDARLRRTFAIPVEAGVRTLTVFAGAQRKDRAVLVSPKGEVVAAGRADARLQTYSRMLIATVQAPAAGTWRLELDGAGLYSVSAHVRGSAAADAPAFLDFRFVRHGGRPGHEGWFPLDREVVAGERVECLGEVEGQAGDVRFAFVARDGRPLGDAPMEPMAEARDQYFGRCTIPAQPFRVVVTGRDAYGNAFRRTTSPEIVPKAR